MKTTTYKAYFIECITNLHVGSGDTNYGLVDNLVQRDPVINHPTINSTSLKGGLREHFERKFKQEIKENKPNINEKELVEEVEKKLTPIFGQPNNTKANEQPQTGNYNFLGADLIALPIRSNYQQYFLTFDDKIVENVNQKGELLIGSEIFIKGLIPDKLYINDVEKISNYDIFLEDKKIDKEPKYKNPFRKNENTNLLTALSKQFAYLKHDNAKPFYKDLPTVARNKVGTGDSDNNLWYEELVPHKSIFITYLSHSGDANTDFENALTEDVIQIGANSSVGYGLCKFHKVLN